MLGHLRVLDLSRVLAGPWACQLLADLGADVVKVERPGVGDDTRHWGPPWLGDTRESAYFAAANRNKRSIEIDLRNPLGRDVVRRLALASDIVIDNFKVGTLEGWGLDGDTLREERPDLVTCSVTGFGQTGPRRELPGYDLLIQAMGGLMSITGAADGPPTKVGVAITDILTGMYAANACLAAVSHRDRTGVGQHIDLALLDVQIAALANQGMNFLASGVTPRRRGNAHPNLVPYEPFLAEDGHLVLAVGNDRQFRALCGVLGHPEWADDPSFATSAARVASRERLVPAIQAIVGTRSRSHWQGALEAVGVPVGPVRDVAEALADTHAQHRGATVAQDHPTAGVVRTLGNPIHASETPVTHRLPPPLLGAHTREVLSEVLGLTDGEIASLRAAGAFGGAA
jgi:crotonobetainyl-CoA:carnitine CoA-transferase CaiB-like acyl-CoA transferase